MASDTIEKFFEILRSTLNPQDLHLNDEVTKAASINTLGVHRSILGVVYPRDLLQIQKIVIASQKYNVALYPVSQGKNIGYGDMTPATSDQLVVSLKHLRAIREYDAKNGEVVVEPGVTQGELATFLKAQNSLYCADVTGATPDASVLGNALEAGFGHTPLGDHRKNILDMEVVLANGTVLNTGEMPTVGPDLAQLFVQSNFGLVTAIRILLFRKPEKVLSFTIAFKSDEAFFEGISRLKDLRHRGVITNLVHSANSTRTLMTGGRFPPEVDPKKVLSEKDALEILDTNIVNFNAWTAVGGIYGFKVEVKEKKRLIRKHLRGIGKVVFFSNGKMNFIDRVLHSQFLMKLKKFDFVRSSFASLKAVHGILQGQPSPVPSQNIFWRVQKMEQLGLMWYSPVIPATHKDMKTLLTATRAIYAKYGFEMPVTLTLVNHKYLTGVFNINFDRTDAADVARAHKAYDELAATTQKLGYTPYRLGTLKATHTLFTETKAEVLEKIKMAFDPKNIIAPGRYGIGATTRANLNSNSINTAAKDSKSHETT